MVSKAALEAHAASKAKSAVSMDSTATGNTIPDNSLSDERLQALSDKAKESVEKQFGNSPNFEFACKRLELFPKFDYKELDIGKVLGKGQFGIVHEIKGVTLRNSSTGSTSIDQQPDDDPVDKDRAFISNHCIRDGDARYAIKLLNPEHFCSVEDFYTGVHDLAIEAHFLAAIEHPNILKLRGLSAEPLGGKTFFLLFDRLYGTLKEKLIEWRLRKHKMGRGLNGLKKSSKQKKMLFLQERMAAAFDLTGAILYLHQNNIIDRDLKPDNVGFDIRGDVKLFDFGLSCEIPNDKEGPYHLTGETGSLIYMAPEVSFSKPYDEKIDIYSLGMVFWEMLALERLYPNFNASMLRDLVMTRGARPAINSKWSTGLQDLLRMMWHKDAVERPTARQVHILMKREISNIDEGEEESDNSHMMRRRSTFVQRRYTSQRTNFLRASKVGN